MFFHLLAPKRSISQRIASLFTKSQPSVFQTEDWPFLKMVTEQDGLRTSQAYFDCCKSQGDAIEKLCRHRLAEHIVQLGRLQCPVLIFHGTEDKVIACKAADELKAAISHSQLKHFKGGHYISHGFVRDNLANILKHLSA